ncbi:hypothetical protein E4U59_002926 [Claviceps monticola]|nr:hypothetical protein E4U59_002926 [Claviceps monticola]
MVQFTSLIAAVVVAIVPVAKAGTCVPMLDYCGHTLSKYNYGESEINEALMKVGFPLDRKDITVFRCNPDGSIKARFLCSPSGCSADGGGAGINARCTAGISAEAGVCRCQGSCCYKLS